MIFQIISVLLFILVIFFLFRYSGKRKFLNSKGSLDKNFVINRWEDIQNLVNLGKPSAANSALIEADKLMDYVLKSKVGNQGTMGDRLKKADKLFSSYRIYQGVWKSHKLRNVAVHETQAEVFYSDVKKAVEGFERGLRDLKLI